MEATWFYESKSTPTGLMASCMACVTLLDHDRRERNLLRFKQAVAAAEKQCRTCEKTLPTDSSFKRSSSNNDGYRSQCEGCHNIEKAANSARSASGGSCRPSRMGMSADAPRAREPDLTQISIKPVLLLESSLYAKNATLQPFRLGSASPRPAAPADLTRSQQASRSMRLRAELLGCKGSGLAITIPQEGERTFPSWQVMMY